MTFARFLFGACFCTVHTSNSSPWNGLLCIYNTSTPYVHATDQLGIPIMPFVAVLIVLLVHSDRQLRDERHWLGKQSRSSILDLDDTKYMENWPK